ncbi:GAF and ANTAR domain-containing protein [Amycolatopsis regifaucium]|uniref:ANTAR domain-containing protein n=1 Tax=Amycolatopsis regifaucium TaxID=546365 RepID=A0A154MK26_9PSEU|nr:GAF and ANTAR domain-containing protein [Amycolatopsis regifaucium]KZB83769.1 Two-component system, response regulator [Amycolatopsis regifaucium]OKA06790.1 ANTAR domain-containing protein [Amycolatopsis regifaucium]
MDQFRDTTSALRELTESIRLDESRDELLVRVAKKVVGLLPQADAATVTLYENDEPSTVAATDESLLPLDKTQYSADEGPCLTAARTGTIVRTRLETASVRWPDFAAAAEQLGVRTALACPLFLPDDGHGYRRRDTEPLAGALNVWSYSENAFDPVESALIAMFTSAISAIVLTASRWAAAEKQAESLVAALETRDSIATAKGIVMARLELNADEAFRWLTEASQHTNRKIREISVLIAEDPKAVFGR